VRGGNVAEGYWRQPELTAAAFRDGWYHSGDVALRDERGLYWFKDRIKNVIISGGENIYPAELERILHGLPGIAEAAVVGRRDERWGEVPVAVVALSDETASRARPSWPPSRAGSRATRLPRTCSSSPPCPATPWARSRSRACAGLPVRTTSGRNLTLGSHPEWLGATPVAVIGVRRGVRRDLTQSGLDVSELAAYWRTAKSGHSPGTPFNE
jgi:fatty-acyl-CoA synthase